jgi:hypothetical protein
MARAGFWAVAIAVGLSVAGCAAPGTEAEAARERFDFGAVVVDVDETPGEIKATLRSATTGEVYAVVDQDGRGGRWTVTGAGELNVSGASAGQLAPEQLASDRQAAAQRVYAVWQGSIDFLR